MSIIIEETEAFLLQLRTDAQKVLKSISMVADEYPEFTHLKDMVGLLHENVKLIQKEFAAKQKEAIAKKIKSGKSSLATRIVEALKTVAEKKGIDKIDVSEKFVEEQDSDYPWVDFSFAKPHGKGSKTATDEFIKAARSAVKRVTGKLIENVHVESGGTVVGVRIQWKNMA